VLTDQDGKQHKFYDDLLKNKVVSINLIFTSCSATCGLETARLREVKRLLGDRLGKDVFFYSISIDPLNDTPAALKEYAKRFDVDVKGWRFLTGKPKDIEVIRQKLGMYDDLIGEDKNKSDHVLHTMLGNQATGRWMKGSPYENPAYTADQLGSWLHNYKDYRGDVARFEAAPTYLRNQSDGEKLFRHRCQSCHTIGSTSGDRPLGPDLQDVVKRRDAKWLSRWLREPNRMIAEKDPIALELLARYKIPMPNISLDDHDVRLLVEFMAAESALTPDRKNLRS
jgi:cytochrome oxidase Cu insertion factor (SCO1/SenC/PrrC family)